MPPYHSSTTALFDSTERINKTDMYNRSRYSGSLPRKYPITDDYDAGWDGVVRSHSNRDSGLVSKNYKRISEFILGLTN